MFSGVITEIYKKVCASTGKKHYELKADFENASYEYSKSYRNRHGRLKFSVLECGNLYRLMTFMLEFSF